MRSTSNPPSAVPPSLEAVELQTGIFENARDYRAWTVSVLVHGLILFGLAVMTRMTMAPAEAVVISSVLDDEEAVDFKFDPLPVQHLGDETTFDTSNPSQASSIQVDDNQQDELKIKLEETVFTPNAPPIVQISDSSQSDVLDAVETSGSTERPGGVTGAIDILTREIAASLRERKTLVIWLFDASLSLKARREAIAKRFKNIYEQLDQLNAGTEAALKTAIVGFGAQTQILTRKPVDDIQKMVQAVHEIVPDESGSENVFSAVRTVTKRWKSYRKKEKYNVMIIVVTDERGDDYARVEEVIHSAKSFAKVYCIGNESPFGREHRYVPWQMKDGSMRRLPVDRGPETLRLERLQLPFWGTTPGALAQLPSGFGPYALTRLCVETSGLYLIVEQSPVEFERDRMLNYQPDYRAIRLHDRDLAKNQAKQALVRAAQLNPFPEFRQPRLRFRADSNNVLSQQISEAQKPMALLDNYLGQILSVLERGEKGRRKLKERRWQVSYDLAVGRVLAMRARAYGYNAILAEMKTDPKSFQDPKNNQWRLTASADTEQLAAETKNLAAQAVRYLKRVVDEHPSTPWALVAKHELSQPMGWQWQEAWMPIPKPSPRPPPPRSKPHRPAPQPLPPPQH